MQYFFFSASPLRVREREFLIDDAVEVKKYLRFLVVCVCVCQRKCRPATPTEIKVWIPPQIDWHVPIVENVELNAIESDRADNVPGKVWNVESRSRRRGNGRRAFYPVASRRC